MAEGREIVARARDWIGVPWRHQGRSRQSGVDCVGLIVVVAGALDLPLEDMTDYQRQSDGVMLLQELHRRFEVIPISHFKIGDIGVFQEGGFPLHVGFLNPDCRGGTVIHAHARRRQVLEENLPAYGQPVAVFRFREVA